MRFNIRHYLNTCAIALLLLVGISSCDPAQAQTPVAIKPIETLTGTEGQTMDEFARQIRRRVHRLSHRYNGEVCGAIYQRNGVYGVEIVTTRSDLSCSMVQPADFTGHTIHTHPNHSHGLFSEQDYRQGPGYLISEGVLYHQQGRGTERNVVLSSR